MTPNTSGYEPAVNLPGFHTVVFPWFGGVGILESVVPETRKEGLLHGRS